MSISEDNSGINMPHIEFDTEALDALTQKDLLVQICYRLDRSFPNWEDELQAAEALLEAKELITGYAADLTEKGFSDLAATVTEVIE